MCVVLCYPEDIWLLKYVVPEDVAAASVPTAAAVVQFLASCPIR